MAQWVLRSKKGIYDYFCIYNFRTKHMKRALGIRFATILNEEMMQGEIKKEMFDIATSKGYENLEWKRVDVLLCYPNERGPLFTLTEEDREIILKDTILEK